MAKFKAININVGLTALTAILAGSAVIFVGIKFFGKDSEDILRDKLAEIQAEVDETKAETIKIVNNSTARLLRSRFKPISFHIKNLSSMILSNPNPNLIAGLIWQESIANPSLIGDGGKSKGLMQIGQLALADVNKRYRTNWVFDQMLNPVANLNAGIRFFEIQFKRMNSDSFATLRAYNCGETGAKSNKFCGKNYAEQVLDKAIFIKQANILGFT